jgi:PadR family transcriptional regulator, regulatory protein PadR
MSREQGDLLQGTLGLLILKALVADEQHGYGIARWVHEVTGEVLEIPEGSLYPALRRLEDRGYITSRWDLSENNRRARYYSLTPAGRKHLLEDASTWLRFAQAVTQVLRTDPAGSGDPAAATVLLRLLPHGERVHRPTGQPRAVHDRRAADETVRRGRTRQVCHRLATRRTGVHTADHLHLRPRLLTDSPEVADRFARGY